MKTTITVSRVYDLPYIAEKDVHAYVDLRLHPADIHRIPELAHQPVLRELVSVLNSKEGPFMTHGCAFALAPPYEPDGTIPLSEESRTAAHWCSSYVTFSYSLMSLNKEEHYVALYDGFTLDAIGTEVCFVIQLAYFLTLFEQNYGAKWGDRNATACVVWVSGWGAKETIAYSRWRNAVRTAVEFFEGFKLNADDVSGVTVSQHMMNDSRMPPS